MQSFAAIMFQNTIALIHYYHSFSASTDFEPKHEQVQTSEIPRTTECAPMRDWRFHETVVMILASSLTIIDIFMIQPLFSLVNH